MNDLIAIPKTTENYASGHVYLIRYNHCKNCYKIGSTSNIFKRVSSLGVRRRGYIELIAFGYAYDRLFAERSLQNILYRLTNKYRAFEARVKIDYQFAGTITSSEYFIMKTPDVCNAIMIMGWLCCSVYIGSPFEEFKVHPKCREIGYGLQLRRFYDASQDRYVPYPKVFENGLPIFEYSDNWDDTPDFTIDGDVV
jgi:hypothetical protein